MHAGNGTGGIRQGSVLAAIDQNTIVLDDPFIDLAMPLAQQARTDGHLIKQAGTMNVG